MKRKIVISMLLAAGLLAGQNGAPVKPDADARAQTSQKKPEELSVAAKLALTKQALALEQMPAETNLQFCMSNAPGWQKEIQDARAAFAARKAELAKPGGKDWTLTDDGEWIEREGTGDKGQGTRAPAPPK